MKRTKTQLRITKLNKALGLARMRLRRGREVAYNLGESDGFMKGMEFGDDALKSMSFWQKVKHLFR